MEKRNDYLDVLKGVAIFLVVVGHSMQFGSGHVFLVEYRFYENALFKVIMSFHMPLFMLVSGYLFFFSEQKHSSKHNFINVLRTFLVPELCWSLMQYLFIVVKNGQAVGIKSFIIGFINVLGYNLWFLWASLICRTVVIIVNHFFKNRSALYVYFLIFAATFVVPDYFYHNFFCFALTKFMFPFFIFGYYFSKNREKLTGFVFYDKKRTLFILAGLGTVFIVMLLFFKRETYIYTSLYYIFSADDPLHQLGIDLYRMFIGLVGSAFFALAVYLTWQHIPLWLTKKIISMGKHSLEIYIVSCYLYIILPFLAPQLNGVNYALMLFESVLITGLSLLISFIMKKSHLLSFLFLGGR